MERPTALMAAAAGGSAEIVQRLLQAGASPKASATSGATALHLAAVMGHREAAAHLIDAGAELDAATRERETPLHWAAATYARRASLIRLLLTAGADPKLASQLGETPLHLVVSWAAEKEDEEVALELTLALLHARAQVNARNALRRTPLHEAAEDGSLGLVRALLDAGANPNAIDISAESPLSAALAHPEVVRLLLANGAKPNLSREAVRITPLHTCVLEGHAESARELVRAGADLERRDAEGRTALALAAREGKLEMFELLVEVGAADRKGELAREIAGCRLRRAAEEGDAARVRELLASGASLEGRPSDRPVLTIAAAAGRLAVVAELLASGVSDAPEPDGRTALHAAEGGHTDVVRALLAAGARPRASVRHGDPDVVGTTPLLAAAQAGSLGSVQALLAAGADANAATGLKETPLLAAALSGSPEAAEIVETLRRAGAKADWATQQCLEVPLLRARRKEPAFVAAAREIAGRWGVPAQEHADFPHGLLLPVAEGREAWSAGGSAGAAPPDPAGPHAVLAEIQEPYRARGVCVLYVPMLPGDHVALLPTTSPYACVAALGPQPRGVTAMLEWLRKLMKSAPFTLYGCAYATLLLRFGSRVRDPEELARTLFRLGSDERGVLERGEDVLTETIKELADKLRTKAPIVRLWWD